MKIIIISFVLCILCHSLSIAQKNDEIIDKRDGHHYKTVKIGDTWWLQDNLNFDTKNGSLCYDNDCAKYVKTYGRLYTWEVANASCPVGWRLSNEEDWKKLERVIGIPENRVLDERNSFGTDEGEKLKEKGTTHWISPNNGTNETQFTALPGGHYNLGQFWGINEIAHFWGGDKSDNEAWYISIGNGSGKIHKYFDSKTIGYKSVRCVKINK